MRTVVVALAAAGVLLAGCSSDSGSSAAGTPSASPSATDGRDAATAGWASKAQRSCAELLQQPLPAGTAADAAAHETRLRDRTRQVVAALKGTGAGTAATTAFVQNLDGIANSSDQLVKLYAGGAKDQAKIKQLAHARDVALADAYGQADKLGMFVCAVVVRGA